MKFALLLAEEEKDSITIGFNKSKGQFDKVLLFEKAWFSHLSELNIPAPKQVGEVVPTETLNELLAVFRDPMRTCYSNRPLAVGDLIWLGGSSYELTPDGWKYRGEFRESQVR